jgi:hypothetical protein
MLLPQNSQSRPGSVFILALQGMEIVYLPGSREIVSRLEPVAPGATALDRDAQKKKESKRQP